MNKDVIYAPFCGIIPNTQYASEVIAPPYDVLSSEEARVKAKDKPYSFLHISKAEIDFDDDISPYNDCVYEKASDNFRKLLEKGVLIRDTTPCFYVYQMTMGEHTQTGLVVGASVKAYNEGRIKRHELTRVVKENDRMKQIRAVKAQTGPALLINKNLPEVKRLLQEIVTKRAPLFDVVGENNVAHRLWRVDNKEEIEFIVTAFAEQNVAYIADGHHRSAAASRLAEEDENSDEARFLAVAFFEEDMRIWDYNRVVFDLNGYSEQQFLSAIENAGFEVKKSLRKKPAHKGQFMMYLNKQWYEMNYLGKRLSDDPVEQLDVSILSKEVLKSILNIIDLRQSERIDFIGGIRGAEEIERVVDMKPLRVGFMLYPTAVAELLAVADNKMLMPPKSTWFEPKLADGVVTLGL